VANFFVPIPMNPDHYEMTSEGGFPHPWKMTVGVGPDWSGVIGLWGGNDREQLLQITSNNPGIITFSEAPGLPLAPGSWPTADRYITVLGNVPGFTILDARNKDAVWCSIQIEVLGGECPLIYPSSSGKRRPIIVTDKWDLQFEADLQVLGYNLSNGVRIPLPQRGPLWPKRETNAHISRVIGSYGRTEYFVSLTPIGHDSYWLTKWLLQQGAESALSKAGAVLIGGTVGPLLAGAATVFVPGETDRVLPWIGECSEGPVMGATSGFNT
jgi:hypothetical protein